MSMLQFFLSVVGFSLRFQVAGYLLLVAGEVVSGHGDSPPPPLRSFRSVISAIFQKALPPPKKAIFIKSVVIISGFMKITSLSKKTTTL